MDGPEANRAVQRAAKHQGARWGQLRAGWEHPTGEVRSRRSELRAARLAQEHRGEPAVLLLCCGAEPCPGTLLRPCHRETLCSNMMPHGWQLTPQNRSLGLPGPFCSEGGAPRVSGGSIAHPEHTRLPPPQSHTFLPAAGGLAAPCQASMPAPLWPSWGVKKAPRSYLGMSPARGPLRGCGGSAGPRRAARAASPGAGRPPSRVLCLVLPGAPAAAAAPRGDTFIWEVSAVLLRKPGWRLPPPHRQHFPVPKTTVPRPLRRQPQCQERLLPSDRRHVLPLWLPARREAGVGRKTTPEKAGRPLLGAGQAAGCSVTPVSLLACRSVGHRAAAPAPSHPTLSLAALHGPALPCSTIQGWAAAGTRPHHATGGSASPYPAGDGGSTASPGARREGGEQPAPVCHSQVLSNQSHFLLYPATGLCSQRGKNTQNSKKKT